MNEALDITVKGIVQGVGFRPFVYRAARCHNVTGWVCNSLEGVIIHAEGEPDDLDAFAITLSESAPAAAHVAEIDLKEVDLEGFVDFEIRFSQEGDVKRTTLVSPDLATCDECVTELFDEKDRRYRYPFINCTNCGPRFTIIDELPYDRPSTSMAPFTMCETCREEYDDPSNRRFHAQPDACFDCGPRLGWIANGSLDSAPYVEGGDDLAVGHIVWAEDRDASDRIIASAVEVLKRGGIVAVKGLGGYHVVCDADNEDAIARLRMRKRRQGKALAVMVSSIDEAKERCCVGEAEQRLLVSPARPIVLMKKRARASLAAGLADGLPELGMMLPSTPLQHLLLHDFGGMLVMTSGNIHDEPIVVDEASAFESLAMVADAFVVNDRAIEGRYDDSVVRVLDGGPAGEVIQFVRRARGYAPAPLNISSPEDAPELFATGPEQKNTFTCVRGDRAFVSQHIGDMESAAVMDAWEETRRRFAELFHLKPSVVACDYHPEYLTSKWAHAQDLPIVQVQHHHAHILSVMGENGLDEAVCGIAFDGTGYGLDGALWGGEIMLANRSAFERFANFAYIPLPGGAAAIKHPARIAFGALWSFDLLDHPFATRFVSEKVADANVYEQMIDKGINCPESSSVGRLFDAASALCGVCLEPRYEGEAAVLFEGVAWSDAVEGSADELLAQACADRAYRAEFMKNVATDQSTASDTSVLLVDPAPVFAALLDDLDAGVPLSIVARRFHDAVVDVIVTMAELIRATYGIGTVVLSGGVFMNRLVTEASLARLQHRGFTVALNRDLPPNDASISYGQAVLGLQARTKE